MEDNPFINGIMDEKELALEIEKQKAEFNDNN